MSSNPSRNSSETDNTCVVCFKNVEIYSIGVCDHPVCFECSTRMRVLCRQNECPICRQDLPKVIFTKTVEAFNVLKAKVEKSNYQDKKFGVFFCSGSIQAAYYQLLLHECPICNEYERRWPFKTFQQLKDHMRREHELYYCDLCVANLRIFTFERKCYNRSELAQHRRKGDTDNTSHRGHPLCEFCDQRYMDSDELFRHLRRDHLYCHFCDADGKHQYYNSYDDLRNHFLEEHFLCEEGECKNEQFTSVYRSDIDLKAHIAFVHGRNLSRSANKQNRTLEVEFTLAPRSRPEQNNRGSRRPYDRRNNDRGDDEGAVGYDNYYMEPGGNLENPVKTFVNPLNLQDFPSLGNDVQATRATSSLTFTSKVNRKGFTGGDFPSLGNSNSSSKSAGVTISGNVNTCQSKDYPSSFGGHSRPPDVTITRTVRGPQGIQRKMQNFPTLSESSTPGSSTVRLSVNSSKDRVKGPNVSIHVNHKSNGAITTGTVQVRPKTAEAFPALSSASMPQPQAQWVTQKPKKQEQQSAKKVAPPPELPPRSLNDFPSLAKSLKSDKAKKSSSVVVNLNTYNSEARNNLSESNKNNVKTEKPKEKSKNGKVEKPCVEVKPDVIENKSKSKKKKGKCNNDLSPTFLKEDANANTNTKPVAQMNGVIKKRSELKIEPLEMREVPAAEEFPALGNSKPPPGFNMKPPPGFHNFNSITSSNKQTSSANINLKAAASPNDLTFTSSSGQCYSILPLKQYHQPPNFSARNNKLIDRFREVSKSQESIMEFKSYSDLFRNGAYPADRYYEHCNSFLGVEFSTIFPELLVLLPDIEKQQELYRIHASKGEKKNLEVCETCRQVIFGRDLRSHLACHTLDNHFPSLGHHSDANNAWKKT